MIIQNYRGYLLAAHPKRQEHILTKGVVLILDHDVNGAIGLQVNRPFTNDISFETVMNNVGLPTPEDRPLYIGGPEAQNRIHVIHSLDWYTANTVKINDYIGVSHDISILTAISKNEGPSHFRVVAGFTRWMPGHLEAEIAAESPWEIYHSWSFIPAAVETLFEKEQVDQWHQVIAESSKIQVASWF